jgi:hypothetical protein
VQVVGQRGTRHKKFEFCLIEPQCHRDLSLIVLDAMGFVDYQSPPCYLLHPVEAGHHRLVTRHDHIEVIEFDVFLVCFVSLFLSSE